MIAGGAGHIPLCGIFVNQLNATNLKLSKSQFQFDLSLASICLREASDFKIVTKSGKSPIEPR